MSIEKLSSKLDRIISEGQEIEELGSGYFAAEGPVWHSKGGYLLFSDIFNNRRMKWTAQEGVTLFSQPTNNANGLTWDLQGRLIVCETGTRRVTRLEIDGSVTVVADHYDDLRLNRPNDVVVKSDGSIYITDPITPLGEELDMDFSGVYRVSPDLSEIKLLTKDITFPNGLTFSPNEDIFYIDDSRSGHIKAFNVNEDGTLVNGHIFCDLHGDLPGSPDGMKVDVEGNVYCTGPGGVWVIDPFGSHLGTILTGAEQTTNCAWGGYDWSTLFITTRDTVCRIQLNIPGIPVPS